MGEKREKKRGGLKRIVLTILIFLSALLLIYFLRSDFHFLNSGQTMKIELEEISRYVFSAPNEIRMVGAGLCVWNQHNIDFLDASGKSLNDRPVLLEKPIISYGKHHVYLFDEQGKELYVLNEKGDNTSTIATENILCVAHELGDLVGYVTRNKEGEILTIAKRNGEALWSRQADKKHFGVFTASEDAKYYGYSTFYFSGGEMISSFTIEDDRGKECLRHGFSGDTVISAKLFQNGSYCYMTKSGFYFGMLNDSGSGVEKNLFSEVLSAEEQVNLSPIAVAYGKTVGLLTKHHFYEVSSAGELLSVYPFVGSYDAVSPLRKGFMLSGKDGIMILENGKLLLQKDQPILCATSNDSMIVLQTETEFQWYRMKFGRK